MELFLMTIAWLFGILSGLYFKLGIVLFVLILIVIYFIRKKSKYLKLFCINQYIIILILSYSISYFQITYLEKSFQSKYQNISQEIKIVGTIISNPLNKEYKTTYTIKVKSINGDTSYQNTKLLLNVKKQKNDVQYTYGNEISFIGEFEEPNAQRNEGGFDYKQYLKTKNIYGIVTTNSKNIEIKKEDNSNFLLKLANTIANKIEEKANYLLEKKEASILTAILIGKKENLEKEVQEAFRNSSLSHMLAISGAHVSYILLGISYLIAKTKISKKIGKIITMILLLFFILITGQTLSVTRACLMAVYLLMASLFYKKVSVLSSISISMLIIMIMNPYSILDVGLQLSYGGTIGIVLFYPLLKQNKQKKKEQKRKKNYLAKMKIKIQEIILISISANIVLFPIMLYHFNTFSFTFLISNLLATPIMGILILLGFITIIFSFLCMPIAQLLAIILQVFIKIFLQIAYFAGQLPFSKMYFATPKLTSIMIYYSSIFLFLWYKKINKKEKKRRIEKKFLQKVKKITKKKLIFILLIITIVFIFDKQIPKNLKIYFIDVGQGDSTFIVTPKQKTILIDGGGNIDKNSFDVGKSTLIPYLLDRGITKIDYIIISHFDSDHVRSDY